MIGVILWLNKRRHINLSQIKVHDGVGKKIKDTVLKYWIISIDFITYCFILWLIKITIPSFWEGWWSPATFFWVTNILLFLCVLSFTLTVEKNDHEEATEDAHGHGDHGHSENKPEKRKGKWWDIPLSIIVIIVIILWSCFFSPANAYDNYEAKQDIQDTKKDNIKRFSVWIHKGGQALKLTNRWEEKPYGKIFMTLPSGQKFTDSTGWKIKIHPEAGFVDFDTNEDSVKIEMKVWPNQ